MRFPPAPPAPSSTDTRTSTRVANRTTKPDAVSEPNNSHTSIVVATFPYVDPITIRPKVMIVQKEIPARHEYKTISALFLEAEAALRHQISSKKRRIDANPNLQHPTNQKLSKPSPYSIDLIEVQINDYRCLYDKN
ncbi:hypothetical protein V9T40_004018 [Parthenolecanium corni]|uniref:Uncharacterized protein n=1 Tax=Parthenolecanium corni TaxID=536013 RepID=A0AAN9Y464_9HEMI